MTRFSKSIALLALICLVLIGVLYHWNEIAQRITGRSGESVVEVKAIRGAPEVEAALSLAESLTPEFKEFDDDTSEELETALKSRPSDVGAQVTLAIRYKEVRKFRDAFRRVELAIASDPKMSDTYCIQGDLLYELGLMNMVARGEYMQKELLFFTPSASSRRLFGYALDSYNRAAKLMPGSLTHEVDGIIVEVCDMKEEFRRSRLERASLYAGGQAPQDVAYTEDQAKAGLWLLRVADKSKGERVPPEGHIDQTASWLISKAMATSREDKHLLKNIVELQAASMVYIGLCATRTSSTSHELKLAQYANRITNALRESGLQLTSSLFDLIKAGECIDREGWGKIEVEVLGQARGRSRRAFTNFYHLASIMTSTSAILSNELNDSTRLSLAGTLSKFPKQLLLNEKLRLEVTSLVKAVESAKSQDQKEPLSQQMEMWFEKVVDYSLEPVSSEEQELVVTEAQDQEVLSWVKKGVNAEMAGNLEGAVKYYDKALQLSPYSYVANFDRGNALSTLSRYTEAIAAYDRALSTRHSAAEVLFNREVTRLRASGIAWPDFRSAQKMLVNDIEGSLRQNRLGAALVVLIECEKKTEGACQVVNEHIAGKSSLTTELGTLDYSIGGKSPPQ